MRSETERLGKKEEGESRHRIVFLKSTKSSRAFIIILWKGTESGENIYVFWLGQTMSSCAHKCAAGVL